MNKFEAFQLLFICFGAYFVPFFSRRLYIPSSVGEIIFGVALGMFFHSMEFDRGTIHFLAEFGFIVLMYLAGLEIDFDNIRKTARKDLMAYFMVIILIILASVAVVLYRHDAPLMVLVYMTVAVGLLFPVLKETGFIDKNSGQALLIIGGIGEAFTLMGLSLFTLFYQYGFSAKAIGHFAGVLAFMVFVLFVMKFTKLFFWWFPHLSRIFILTGNSTETGMRATFVNIFVFVSVAVFFDMEPIVGAFIGGMLFAIQFHDRENIQERLSGIGYGFLVPIFFINVGMGFNVTDFLAPNVLMTGIIISLIMLAVRIFSVFPLYFTSLPKKILIISPFSLAYPLTLMVATAAIGKQYNAISSTESASIVFAAMFTAIVLPSITRALVKKLYF